MVSFCVAAVTFCLNQTVSGKWKIIKSQSNNTINSFSFSSATARSKTHEPYEMMTNWRHGVCEMRFSKAFDKIIERVKDFHRKQEFKTHALRISPAFHFLKTAGREMFDLWVGNESMRLRHNKQDLTIICLCIAKRFVLIFRSQAEPCAA